MIIFIADGKRSGDDAFILRCVKDFCAVEGMAFPEGAAVVRNGGNKPVLSCGGIFFSVTHGGEYTLCAVSAYETGIDIERIRDIEFIPLCERFFPYEKPAGIKEFFDMFTAKEAYAKRHGKALIEVSKLSTPVTRYNYFQGYSFSVNSGDEEIIFTKSIQI